MDYDYEPDIDAPDTPPETEDPSALDEDPVAIDDEEPESPQENDSEMQVQDSADLNTEGNDVGPNSEADAPMKAADKVEKITQLPLSKMKQIMKLDPEVSLVSQEAAFLITKATELFINFTAKECYSFTLSKKKKTVMIQDLNSAVDSDGPLFFLQGCLEN
ncbi:unnamed protein product [Bemisia tabaci]|uniref:Transcription factor CBF/NF-Y/archaeal histone domain-containing protein n=1 Tax=Bemisia tabaci TaxID=7038 RepID=A0A9P0F4I0_BEMTA|nr:PREDICTED: DNA polymerase epsilon subunit 4 [Bemisia tabaci]CAH0388622.1 unnamed protein product [Bemisia tabaci]